MVLFELLVLLCTLGGVTGECLMFATGYYKQHHQDIEREALCPGQLNLKCPPTRYRTFDGSCNNLIHPQWGMANMPMRRAMKPSYTDGVDELRWKSVTGAPLPKARDVVVSLLREDPAEDISPVFTFMHITVGNFIDHDFAFRGFGDNITGCGTDFCDRRGECDPILIPYGDPGFKRKCMNFIRSKPVYCGHFRDQTNRATSYIDLSLVYGMTNEKAHQLRDMYHGRGRMNVTKHPFDWHLKNLLPQRVEPLCREVGGPILCFDAGDPRGNSIQNLNTFHLLFMRAHNTIENKLHYLNPHWCPEKLFQEARKIAIAAWQRITYKEYLPLLMGPDAMYKYNLIPEEGYHYWKGYDPRVQADITNEFNTGAFRFGHAQVPNRERFTDEYFQNFKEQFFSQHSFRPALFYQKNLVGSSGMDAIIRGMADNPALKVRMRYSTQMTDHLFTENPPFGEGFDLGSLDIKRGRDHGVNGYNEWRRYCGLKTASCFEDLPDISPWNRKRLQSVYKDVEDIDLMAGGLAEEHLFGSMVGPTFSCLLGEQFQALREGDRFWHELPDKLTGFTPDQLKEIRAYSVAYLMCENGDRITKIQPNVMLQPLSRVPLYTKKTQGKFLSYLYRDGPNEYISCHDIYIPDLSPWKEDAGYGHGCDV